MKVDWKRIREISDLQFMTLEMASRKQMVLDLGGDRVLRTKVRAWDAGWSGHSLSLVTVSVLLLSSSDILRLTWPVLALAGATQNPLSSSYVLHPIPSYCPVQWSQLDCDQCIHCLCLKFKIPQYIEWYVCGSVHVRV